MTDKSVNDHAEEYIKNIIDKYATKLGLGHFRFIVKNSDCSYLECDTNYPYNDVEIGYSDSFANSVKEGNNVEYHVLHELCHPITEPLYRKAIQRYVSSNEILDERERLTDMISTIIYGILS